MYIFCMPQRVHENLFSWHSPWNNATASTLQWKLLEMPRRLSFQFLCRQSAKDAIGSMKNSGMRGDCWSKTPMFPCPLFKQTLSDIRIFPNPHNPTQQKNNGCPSCLLLLQVLLNSLHIYMRCFIVFFLGRAVMKYRPISSLTSMRCSLPEGS